MRPPTRLKQLAKLTLEYPPILEDIKAIAEALKVSYDSAKKLRSRYLKRSDGSSYICPECLSPMKPVDGGIVCPSCGYYKAVPAVPAYKEATPTPSLFGLGSYIGRRGEWRGYDRFLHESLSEAQEALKGYTLRPETLDLIGRLLRKYAPLHYKGKSRAIDRFRLILLVLSEASQQDPRLKVTAWEYMLSGPLQLGGRKGGTKGKLSEVNDARPKQAWTPRCLCPKTWSKKR